MGAAWQFFVTYYATTPGFVYPSVAQFLGSGSEGIDDLCFDTYGEFSPSPSSLPPGSRTGGVFGRIC